MVFRRCARIARRRSMGFVLAMQRISLRLFLKLPGKNQKVQALSTHGRLWA
jgi:hypothetical protein